MYWKKIGQLRIAPMNKAPVVTTFAAVLPIHRPPSPAMSAAISGRKTMSSNAISRPPGHCEEPKATRQYRSAPLDCFAPLATTTSGPSPAHPVDVVDRDRAAAAEED